MHKASLQKEEKGIMGRKELTSCEVSVDGLLGHTMQPLHVIFTVPDSQPLPRPDVPTGSEVNSLTVLKGHQVLLPLLSGYDYIPEGVDKADLNHKLQ